MNILQVIRNAKGKQNLLTKATGVIRKTQQKLYTALLITGVIVSFSCSAQASLIVTLPGTFQTYLGCPEIWDTTCTNVQMDGPNEEGDYTLTTDLIPSGLHEFKIAIDYSWNENYGENGQRDGPNMSVFATSGYAITFVYHPDTHITDVINTAPPTLSSTKAMWLTKDLMAIEAGESDDTYKLAIAPIGGNLNYAADLAHIADFEKIVTLQHVGKLSAQTHPDIVARHPNLVGFNLLKLEQDDSGVMFSDQTESALLNFVRDALKRNVGLEVTNGSDNSIVIDVTQLQIGDAIDDVYAEHALNQPLGLVFDNNQDTVSFNLWAPTAIDVFALTGPYYNYVPMTQDPITGIWHNSETQSKSQLNKQFYFYCVSVYSRVERKIIGDCNGYGANNDPYAPSMVVNQYNDWQPYGQVLDIDDPDLKPEGWDSSRRPVLPEKFVDSVIYELHIRDFSSNALNGVPSDKVGLYDAFSVPSVGRAHLQKLAQHGLTHVQIMPVQDFNSVNENRDRLITPDWDYLSTFASNSSEQREYLIPLIDQDAFNWGYDPVQYFAPDGSYATNPNDGSRVRELRGMVQAIHDMGLGVNLDVVFSHQFDNTISSLRRIVPDYYIAIMPPNNPYGMEPGRPANFFGQVPATHHKMVARLVKDATLSFVKDYKVDGFRFDGMFEATADLMKDLRSTFDELTLEHDGIDGKKIMLYGEGDQSTIAADKLGGISVATPLNLIAEVSNLAGSKVGSFGFATGWAITGSAVFNTGDDPRAQGFIMGLGSDDTGYIPKQKGTNTAAEINALQILMIQSGLTGRLANYPLADGTLAGNLTWDGFAPDLEEDNDPLPIGVTLDPSEYIASAGLHDGLTLFDSVMIKAPLARDMDTRIRMHNLGVDLAMLSQGVPFFHAGQDFLRSKAGSNNTYNSGDWFNSIDFTMSTNNWSHGMPIVYLDADILQTVHDAFLEGPTPEQMQRAQNHFLEMLSIRKTVPLFRLETAQDIIDSVSFYDMNTPSVIGMNITHTTSHGNVSRAVVFFNANKDPISFTDSNLASARLKLHPAQLKSDDPIVKAARFNKKTGTFYIPARTTAVFVDKALICLRPANGGKALEKFVDYHAVLDVLQNHPLSTEGGCD